jgi:hypothetical protein
MIWILVSAASFWYNEIGAWGSVERHIC